MKSLNWRHILGGFSLSASLLAGVPHANAESQASGKMGWIAVNGYTTTRYKQDLKDGRNQSENTGFWGFYYAFAYNLRDIPNKVCFAGNPEIAITEFDDIMNASAREDAEQIHDVQMLQYHANTDRISMEVRNKRPENDLDRENFVKVEIVRCGVRAPKQEAGLNSLTGVRLESTLSYILQKTVWDDRTPVTLTRRLDPQSVINGREIALLNKNCVIAQSDRDNSITELQAGDRLKVMVVSDQERLEKGDVVMVLKRDGDSILRNSVGVRIECMLPSTSTLRDLEQALENTFRFDR